MRERESYHFAVMASREYVQLVIISNVYKFLKTDFDVSIVVQSPLPALLPHNEERRHTGGEMELYS